MNKCKWCNGEPKRQFKDGSFCCSLYYQSCPIKRKEAGERQAGKNNPMFKKIPWNKGLTKYSDCRLLNYGKKISKAIKYKYKKGRLVWNKGLTKEFDIRIKNYGIKVSRTKKGVPNYKNRKPIEQSRTKCFNNFRNLFKQDLYTCWVFPILQRDNFSCVICSANDRLEVHHLYSYNKIFENSMAKLKLNLNNWQNWTKKQIKNLKKIILSKHTLDIGITVCPKHHGEQDKFRAKFLIKGKLPWKNCLNRTKKMAMKYAV